MQDQIKAIGAAKSELTNDDTKESTEAKELELQIKLQGLLAGLLKKTRYGFIVDYVRLEDIPGPLST